MGRCPRRFIPVRKFVNLFTNLPDLQFLHNAVPEGARSPDPGHRSLKSSPPEPTHDNGQVGGREGSAHDNKRG